MNIRFILLTILLSVFHCSSWGLQYEILSDSTVQVSKEPKMEDSDVIIPETIEIDGKTYTVVSIADYGFSSLSSLRSISIPSSVKSIGSYAFENCEGLEKAEFASIEALCNIQFANGSANPLRYAHHLYISGEEVTDVDIPTSVTSIKDFAFNGCSGLTSVEIPNSVTSIGNAAFQLCIRLTSVEIPNSVTSIGEYAFYKCIGLTSVEIPNSVTSIEEATFAYCSSLESAVIGNAVTSIGPGAFYCCENLASVLIGNSVQKIGELAFDGCDIVRLAYPYNTLSNKLEDWAEITISYSSYSNIIEDGGVWSSDKSIILFAPWKEEYVIPNSVTSIGNDAFSHCYNLKSLIIPNSVSSIGENAFEDCNNIIKLAYPSNLKFPFNEYHYPKSVIAYNPTEAIIEDGWIWGPDKSAIYFVPISFEGEEGEYTIPETVSIIGDNAFGACDGLTSIVALNSNAPTTYNNSFYSLYDNATLTIPDNAYLEYLGGAWGRFKNIKLSDSGLELGMFSDGVFKYRLYPDSTNNTNTAVICGAESSSSKITIPERFTDDSDPNNPVRYYVKGIGWSAFKDSKVNNIEFNSRAEIEVIGDYAFYGKSLSSPLPNTVTSIGNYAFYDASFASLDSLLTIPVSLKSIGTDAFSSYGISKTIISDLKAWCDIDFSNAGSNPCFVSKNGLWLDDAEIIDLVIPEGVTEIKPYSFCIYPSSEPIYSGWDPSTVSDMNFCGRLKSVSIPSSVKSIGDGAFIRNGFKSISIPASVDYIGHQAFMSYEKTDNGNKYSKSTIDNFVLEDGLTPIMIEPDVFEITDDYTKGQYSGQTDVRELYLGRQINRLPDGVKYIYTVTIGNTIDFIPEGLFANMSYLKTINGGSYLTTIKENAFSGCKDLQYLSFGNSLISIGNNAFKDCSSLQSFAFSTNLTTVGDFAFSNCKALTEVILPPSVETIGASAFAGNSKLESIIMGHRVKSIGEKAFDGCPANTVSITAQTPPTAPNNTFSSYSGKLYVQGEKTKEAYYDAFTCWDRFDSYVMIDAEEIKIAGGIENISGKAGDTFQLTASIWPENVTLPQIFWRSTNPEIATVDQNGLVTLHVDLDQVKTRAQGDADIDGTCTIIAETLYNDGPVAQLAIDPELNAVQTVFGSYDNSSIDYSKPYEVYNLNGQKVSDSKEGLAKGIYILRQGNAAVKTVIND